MVDYQNSVHKLSSSSIVLLADPTPNTRRKSRAHRPHGRHHGQSHRDVEERDRWPVASSCSLQSARTLSCSARRRPVRHHPTEQAGPTSSRTTASSARDATLFERERPSRPRGAMILPDDPVRALLVAGVSRGAAGHDLTAPRRLANQAMSIPHASLSPDRFGEAENPTRRRRAGQVSRFG